MYFIIHINLVFHKSFVYHLNKSRNNTKQLYYLILNQKMKVITAQSKVILSEDSCAPEWFVKCWSHF